MMKKLLACACALVILMIGTEASAQTILAEDFEGGGFPSGWSQTTMATDGGWIVGSNLASTFWPLPPHTTYIATNDDACNCDKSEDRLISPAMNMTAYSGMSVYVEFAMSYDMITYGGATEDLVVQVSTDGVTFTDVETISGTGTGDWDWRDVVVDLSAYAGQPVVHVAWTYSDGGGWEYGAAIDDVRVFAPLAVDVAGVSVDLGFAYYEAGAVPIEGTIRNVGSSTVTSMDINYRIDGGATVTQSVSGVSVAPFDSYTFTHATDWNATAGSAPQNIEIWATNINGGMDMDMSNDMAEEDVYVVATTTPRHVVTEHFTSSNCPPCASANPVYQGVLNANAGTVTNLSHHVWWPASTDPMYAFYSDGADARVPYYGTSGVPDLWVDGSVDSYPGTDAEAQILDRAAFNAIFSIDGTVELDMTTKELSIDVDVESLADYWNSDVTIHTFVVEDYIPGPNTDPNANAENEFHNVVRAMLPNPSGATMTSLTAGGMQNVNHTYAINENEINPIEVSVTIMVQHEGSTEIMQGRTFTPTLVNLPSGIEENNVVDFINIYPNPTSSFATLTFENTNATDLEISVYDVTGKLMETVASGTFIGRNDVRINTTNLPNGMYYVAMTSAEGRQMQQFQVIH